MLINTTPSSIPNGAVFEEASFESSVSSVCVALVKHQTFRSNHFDPPLPSETDSKTPGGAATHGKHGTGCRVRRGNVHGTHEPVSPVRV